MESRTSNSASDRASPQNDAQANRPTPVTNVLGLPGSARARLKTRAQKKIRFATLNVGTLTGRSGELADLLHRRRVQCAFLQETRWKGAKSRQIGHGFKLIYTGSESRNGVAVVLSEEYADKVMEVNRISDRLMMIKLLIGRKITNVISAYAPQIGLADSVRSSFWNTFEDILQQIPLSEYLIVGGDFNGHIGEKCEELSRVHGGFGYGQLNSQGEELLNTCLAADLAVVNSFFQKKEAHLVTYKSGPVETQIDFLLIRHNQIGKVRNCKVIPGESITSQHRLLVMDVLDSHERPLRQHCRPSIKWWKLKNEKKLEFQAAAQKIDWKVEGKSSNELWQLYQSSITQIGRDVLTTSKGGRRIDKETGWWNKDVQEAVSNKKELFKKWQRSQSPQDKEDYTRAKNLTKKIVAKARAAQYAPLYDMLETFEGQKLIYKLAKSRSRASKDITKCVAIRNSAGYLVTEPHSIKDQWRSYFIELSNQTLNVSQPTPQAPNLGLIPPITPDEVKKSLSRMKNEKACGHDDIPIEAWKAMSLQGIHLLTELFNTILFTSRMPDPWRINVIVPTYKGKGSVQECGNYRGIKLMSHTMKLFERILDQRLRQECSVSECQYGFKSGCSTMDPIFALRTLMETHIERNQPLHFAFLDLQKAFDCVPRGLIWWALRSKSVPEEYIRIIQDMYAQTEAIVRTAIGDTATFPITVGVHQGSVLSPYLFCIVLDALSADIQTMPPWLMKYADDIVLISKHRSTLEAQLNAWKNTLENGGLKLNTAKTEYMACSVADQDTILVDNEPVKRADKFKYLGSVLHDSGSIDYDVKSRIAAAWTKWRELTAITCDPRVPIRLKGLVYKSIIRPVMLYGSEAWPALTKHTRDLHANEMKMLRWMCGVTRLDKIRNEHIRGSLGVRDIADKIQESRLRWFGHLLRRPQDYVGHRCLNMPVAGQRSRGRPKKRWIDIAQADARANGLRREDAKDRAKWKQHSRKADPGVSRDKR